jgi:hypothetical protein
MDDANDTIAKKIMANGIGFNANPSPYYKTNGKNKTKLLRLIMQLKHSEMQTMKCGKFTYKQTVMLHFPLTIKQMVKEIKVIGTNHQIKAFRNSNHEMCQIHLQANCNRLFDLGIFPL